MNLFCKSAANRKTSPSVKILVKVHLSNLRISPKQQPQWIVLTVNTHPTSNIGYPKSGRSFAKRKFKLTTFEETKNFTRNFGWIQLKCPSKTEDFFLFRPHIGYLKKSESCCRDPLDSSNLWQDSMLTNIFLSTG